MNLPDIYFLPEWARINQELDKGLACTFDFKHPLGRVYYSFIKRKVPESLSREAFFDTITPFGFGGPVILECDPADKELLLSEYNDAFDKYCLDENILAEYVRFSPWLKNHLDFENIYTLTYRTCTLYTDLTVRDIFMEEYDSKIRNQIRKAEKKGVEIEFDHSVSSINEFIRLYQFTLNKTNVDDYYNFDAEFLKNSLKALNNNQFIVNARLGDQYITSAIFLNYGDYLHYHLAANDYRYYSLNANSLILREASLWGQRNGKKQLHLGGAPSDELVAFKKQFTKKGICDFYIGKKIRNEKKYNELVDLKLTTTGINDSSYFPLYRG